MSVKISKTSKKLAIDTDSIIVYSAAVLPSVVLLIGIILILCQ